MLSPGTGPKVEKSEGDAARARCWVGVWPEVLLCPLLALVGSGLASVSASVKWGQHRLQSLLETDEVDGRCLGPAGTPQIRVPANSLGGGHIQSPWGQRLKVTRQGWKEASTSPASSPGTQGSPAASTPLPPAQVRALAGPGTCSSILTQIRVWAAIPGSTHTQRPSPTWIKPGP